jgi:hypothetical protein
MRRRQGKGSDRPGCSSFVSGQHKFHHSIHSFFSQAEGEKGKYGIGLHIYLISFEKSTAVKEQIVQPARRQRLLDCEPSRLA